MPEKNDAEVRRVLAGFAPVWQRVTGGAEPECPVRKPPETPPKKPRPPMRHPTPCPSAPLAAGLVLCAAAYSGLLWRS